LIPICSTIPDSNGRVLKCCRWPLGRRKRV